MKTKKGKKKPKNGDKEKFFGIWFVYEDGVWCNEFIPFLKYRNRYE